MWPHDPRTKRSLLLWLSDFQTTSCHCLCLLWLATAEGPWGPSSPLRMRGAGRGQQRGAVPWWQDHLDREHSSLMGSLCLPCLFSQAWQPFIACSTKKQWRLLLERTFLCQLCQSWEFSPGPCKFPVSTHQGCNWQERQVGRRKLKAVSAPKGPTPFHGGRASLRALEH